MHYAHIRHNAELSDFHFVHSQALDRVIIHVHHNIMLNRLTRMSVSGALNAINGKIGRLACVRQPLQTNWPSWDGKRRMSEFRLFFSSSSFIDIIIANHVCVSRSR